jgi:hypothetical protein
MAAMAVGAILASQQPIPKAALLVTGARIVDVAGNRYRAPAAILIENGRITSVTPEPPAQLPAGILRVSAAGAAVLPGFIDAHAWAAPTPDLDADYFYLLGLAHGVTGYRVLNVRTNWGVAQRGRAASGAIPAPRIWTSGRGINQGASPDRWLFDAPDAASASEEVVGQTAAGVDWIAGYETLGPDIYAAMVRAARGSRVRISGRPGASSMADLAWAGVASIESLAYPMKAANGPSDEAWLAAGAQDLASLQTRLVRARVTLVPMMTTSAARAFPEEIANDASLEFLSPGRRAALTADLAKLPKSDVERARRSWASQAAFLQRFVRAGGRVAAGTGFETRGYPVPGAGLHRELASLVRAGLTPVEALRAATTTAAELVGAGTGMTSFAPGTEANLVIVQGDPLRKIEDAAAIVKVIRAGEALDPKELISRAKLAIASRAR